MQPLRWQSRPDGDVMVDLRCPECHTWMQACHSADEMEELDRAQTAGRDELRAAYERRVAESMEALAACLHTALERDLVGADDFAPRRPLRAGGPGGGLSPQGRVS